MIQNQLSKALALWGHVISSKYSLVSDRNG